MRGGDRWSARRQWIADLVLADLALHGASTVNAVAKRTLEDGNVAAYCLQRNYQQVRLVLHDLKREGQVRRVRTAGPGGSDLWSRHELPLDLRDFELDVRQGSDD